MSEVSVPRGVVIVATLVVLFCLVAFFLSLVVAYVGDEYVSPSFSEQSVPPARAH